MTRRVSLGLQGGGAHGAFTWGALDRIMDEVDAGRLEIAAISGASAGGINAVVAACGLVEGGPALAKSRLAELWRTISARGALGGNALFFGEPGPWGFNIDWSPGAIALEALGLVVSPDTNPFYRDALGPLLGEVLPPARLAALNEAGAPRVFVTATDTRRCTRRHWSQPDLSVDALRASACLPTEFKAVEIDGVPYWDGGYLANPALDPLLPFADEMVLVLVNPLDDPAAPPHGPRAILSRLNQITFNASVVLELNAIEAINSLLGELRTQGVAYAGRYRPIQVGLVRDEPFMAGLGTVSKSSTSRVLLDALHGAGFAAADRFFATGGDGVKPGLLRKVLGTETAALPLRDPPSAG